MMILLLQHGAKVTGLARQPYLSPPETIISILRVYIGLSNGEIWDGRENGDRSKKAEAVGMILDQGLDSPTLDARDINNTLTFAAILGNQYLAEMLLLRAQKRLLSFEVYVSSALIGMMSYFSSNHNAHLDDIISTLLQPLSSDSKCNALNCALRLFLRDSAKRNQQGMTVAIAMFRARQALDLDDEDFVEESSLLMPTAATATGLFSAITKKYSLRPHDLDWKPQVKHQTPLYGPNERDLFVPVYKRPMQRIALLQDGSPLFSERRRQGLLSNSEGTLGRRVIYHFS